MLSGKKHQGLTGRKRAFSISGGAPLTSPRPAPQTKVYLVLSRRYTQLRKGTVIPDRVFVASTIP